MTSFGIMTWAEPDKPIRQIGEVARLVEQYGFDSLWVWDTPLYTRDAYAALLLAALNTNRIRLGPCVSNPITRHLAVIVNSISTLDDLSEGRAVLGFAGGGPRGLKAMGHAPPNLSQFREHLIRLHTLLNRGEVMIDSSARYSVSAVNRRVPIYVAAAGPKMLRLGAELSDGVFLAGPNDLDATARRIEYFRQGLKDAGRKESDAPVNLEVAVSPDSDPRLAVDDLKGIVAHLVIRRSPESFPSEFVDSVTRIHSGLNPRTSPAGLDRGDLGIVPDALVKHMAIAGSEKECLERIKEIIALKPDEIIFRLMPVEAERRLKALASLVAKAG